MTGHAEVDAGGESVVQVNEDVLGAALIGENASAAVFGFDGAGGLRTGHAGMKDAEARDGGAIGVFTKAADDVFDFREFGHGAWGNS